jgi:hypothetical protein
VSNLKTWLRSRRSKFYEGAELEKHVSDFLAMVERGAVVHEFTDAIIVNEPFGLEGNYRQWLLFDRFTRGTARAIKQVSDNFTGGALYASSHDKRIRDLLLKFGYTQYNQDEHDYYLVKRS